MCLYTYDKEPLIAKEDIICYKTIIYNRTGSRFFTPFLNKEVTEYIKSGEVWHDCASEQIIKCQKKPKDTMYEIGEGFIHAYKEVPGGGLVWLYTYKVYTCIIPKGTRYYVGIGNDICAKAIKFIEEIK